MKISRLTLVVSGALLTGLAVVSCSGSAKAKLNLLFKDGTKPGVAASVGGEEVLDEALVGDATFELYEAEKRIYEIKRGQLEKILQEKLIGAEAKKAGMEFKEYVEKKVLKGDPKISADEIKKFAKARGVPDSSMNDQLKERIANFLKDRKKDETVQSYLAGLTKNSPIEVYFKKPVLNVKVDSEGSPMSGSADAKVTVYEFSDFQCPFCSKGAEVVDQLKKKYGSKINVVFKHTPLPMHPEAKPASQMSMCVLEQGKDKFWKFHTIAFEKQKDGFSTENLLKLAKAAGANEAKAKECFEAKKYEAFVEKDLMSSERLGIKSTPTFIINRQAIAGAQDVEAFQEIIDEELAAK